MINKPKISDPHRDAEPMTLVWNGANQNRFWTSSQFVRFVIIPITVSLIVTESVLWIHAQLSSGIESEGDPATVQVQLLRPPQVAPVPARLPPSTSNAAIGRERLAVARETDVGSASISSDHVDLPTPATDPNAEPVVDDVPTPLSLRPTDAILNFQQALLRQIRRFQRYPEAARRTGLHGTVETYFVVRRDGTLLDAKVQSSSGQLLLDEEAVQAIQRAQPFPPIPAGLPDRLGIRLAIAFSPS